MEFAFQEKDGSFTYKTTVTNKISGIAIPEGITLIVGGGFHVCSYNLWWFEYCYICVKIG